MESPELVVRGLNGKSFIICASDFNCAPCVSVASTAEKAKLRLVVGGRWRERTGRRLAGRLQGYWLRFRIPEPALVYHWLTFSSGCDARLTC